MTPANVERLLTVDEALALLRISRSKLHELVRVGDLRAVRFGRRTLFRAESIREFIEQHETREKPATAKVRGIF